MIKSIPKQFGFALLLLLFMVPQSVFAQEIPVINSDAEKTIKQYEQGYLTNPTFAEKQIISEYMESLESTRPYISIPIHSPEAVILTENFDAATPPAFPVGEVERVERDSGDTFARVYLRPFAALDQGREVLLIEPQATSTALPAEQP
jgi:hypothetical protein